MKKTSLKTNVFLNLARTAASLVFPLVTFPYSSRILLPEGIGKTVFANSIVSWFTIIAMLGVNAYGIREAAKLRNHEKELSKFIKEIFFINTISTTISYGLFFIVIFSNSVFFDYRGLLIVYSITILFTALGIEWLYTALEDFIYITIRSLVFQVLGLIFLFIFVKSKDDLLKYAFINIFSSVGSNICNFLYARKIVFIRNYGRIEIKKHLKSLLILFALAITSSIYTLLDTTMLGIIGNPADVGIYTAATKINRIVLALVVSGCTVLLPRLSYFYGNNEREKFLNLFYKLLETIILLGFPCAVGLCVIAEPLIILFAGKEFVNAVPVMRIMNPLIVIIGASNCIGVQLFMPLGKERLTLYSDMAGATVNFTLNFLFIRKFGVVGAAIGSLFAETTVLFVQLVFARKIVSPVFFMKKIFFYFCLSSIMGVFVFFISLSFQNFFLKISFSIFAGVVIYLALVFLTKRKFILSFFSKNMEENK